MTSKQKTNEKPNKMIKREKGITLIVLIVTIVVLIILTGVSINLALGDNGIIGIAKEETSKYAQSVANDQAELGELENLLKSERINWENSGTGGGSEVENKETGGGETEEPVVGIPLFTYTGDYEILNDYDGKYTSEENWRIRFLTSGVLTFTDLRGAADGIDIFLVGGGGGGAGSYYNCNSGGGGGGYTTTAKGISVDTYSEYPIKIGNGGSAGSDDDDGGLGGETLAFRYSASGGKGGYDTNSMDTHRIGGDGGSGGGGGHDGDNGGDAGSGGSNGSDGSGTYGGKGQGTTTREFR